MNIKIGSKIKSLRKKADVTQDKLADYLGITPQAISRWESETAYPDIEIIPMIANFFNVTTDELLGVDITKAKEKQEEYINGVEELYKQWKLVEMVELARKACHEFPGNLEMLNNLSWCLYQSYGVMSKANLDEAIDIANKILEDSTDTLQRHTATVRLCYCYNEKGDKEKAMEYAGQLPSFSQTGQYIVGRLGLSKDEDKAAFLQSCIPSYYDALTEVLIQYADADYTNTKNELNHAEKIEVLENILKIQQIIYGNDLCDQHFDAYEYNRIIACIYLLIEEKDKALDYLETAFFHAEKFMEYKDGDKYKSIVLKNKISRPHSSWSRSPFEDMLDRFTNQNRYDVIRNDPRFVDMLDKVKLFI